MHDESGVDVGYIIRMEGIKLPVLLIVREISMYNTTNNSSDSPWPGSRIAG